MILYFNAYKDMFIFYYIHKYIFIFKCLASILCLFDLGEYIGRIEMQVDWIGGVGVLNIGYSRPEVVEAVQKQAEKYFHTIINVVVHEGYIELAEKFNEIMPCRGVKKKTYFANSGAEADETAFCEKAKKHNLMLVRGSAFSCPGYVRITYCNSLDKIQRSLPQFEKLAQEYGLK